MELLSKLPTTLQKMLLRHSKECVDTQVYQYCH
jgi:hypothetical protein